MIFSLGGKEEEKNTIIWAKEELPFDVN